MPNIVDYALPSVRQLLADSSPYVRRTAVIGVAKLYRIASAKIKGERALGGVPLIAALATHCCVRFGVLGGKCRF